ncbi:MAG: DotH/IcmK family type IV secretion protein [Gammaproteobacteria bacterium]
MTGIIWIKTIVLCAVVGLLVIPVFTMANSVKSSSALMSLVKSFGSGDQEQQSSQSTTQQLSLTPVQTSQKSSQYDPHGVFTTSSPFEEQAFRNVSRQALPMTPEQIVRLKQMLAETQRAQATSADAPPKPVSTTQMVDLAPGSVPTPIRMQQGFITSIVFVDNTGAPWPIESCNIGNPKAFNLLPWQPGSNTIMIQALSMYTYGNIAVKLQELATPVMLTLVPGQKVVDYRVDLRVQQAGPNSQGEATSDTLPAGAKDVLLGVLDGVPPDGAQPLEVLGGDCQAWQLGNKMYLRTRFTVLSPSWIAVMTSSDGTKAYEMNRSSDVLVSRYGKTVNLRIRER